MVNSPAIDQGIAGLQDEYVSETLPHHEPHFHMFRLIKYPSDACHVDIYKFLIDAGLDSGSVSSGELVVLSVI